MEFSRELIEFDRGDAQFGVFANGISSVIVGKSIDTLGKIGAVNGSSLTPNAFNTAVAAIKTQAKA